ncbi:MAG: hypothetical protein JNK74_11335 [Candidatus Hydrogenedentes bacterium]|nr:hypothetical protein [Candidatus Hydrogenedentota bacterium]
MNAKWVGVFILLAIVLLSIVGGVMAIGARWRANIRTAVNATIECANRTECGLTAKVAGAESLIGFTPEQIQSVDFSNPYRIIVNTDSATFYLFEFHSSESSAAYRFDRVEKHRWVGAEKGGLYE